MSKAILILDKMPKSCLECEILDNDELTCIGMKVEYGNLNNRQTWCPLKPMPKEEVIPIDAEIMYSWYLKGYNECLRLLRGEEE